MINEFREYARQKYIQQGEIKQSVETIAEQLLNLNDNQTIYLVWFCKTLPCHGDLIRSAIINVANNKSIYYFFDMHDTNPLKHFHNENFCH